MRLVFPSVEVVGGSSYPESLRLSELGGRICTQTCDRMRGESTEDAERFVGARIDQGHCSIIEHASLTVKFVFNRKAMTQCVRHRLSAHSVESTRYCNYTKERFEGDVAYVFPSWKWGACPDVTETAYYTIGCGSVGFECLFGDDAPSELPVLKEYSPDKAQFCLWYNSNSRNSEDYKSFLRNGGDLDTASELLNSAVKCEYLTTKNLRMWMDFFDKRTGKPVYSGLSYLASDLLEWLRARYPIFFNREVFPKGV